MPLNTRAGVERLDKLTQISFLESVVTLNIFKEGTLASMVLPVPGGPNSNTPFHGRLIPCVCDNQVYLLMGRHILSLLSSGRYQCWHGNTERTSTNSSRR